MAANYSEKLRHPEWFKLRRQIWDRDKDTCQLCGDKESEMHVHHLSYEWGKDPWDYPLNNFQLLCKDCHSVVEDLKKFQEVKHIEKRINKYGTTLIVLSVTKEDNADVATIFKLLEGGKIEYLITISIESIDFISNLSKTVFKH